MHEALIARLERYFMSSDPNHPVLDIGDNTPACANVRTALVQLGLARSAAVSDQQSFDETLAKAVKEFQTKNAARNTDGRVGPGTRQLLVSQLLKEVGTSWFDRLERTGMPTVFLSYAWADAAKVDKLDQWLSDHGVHVTRDINKFLAGSNVKSNITQSVFATDKTIAVYSRNSIDRDWPRLERQIAEHLESEIKTDALIYLCLDDTPLPLHDPHRIAIFAKNLPLKEIGQRILKALKVPTVLTRHEYNEDDPL